MLKCLCKMYPHGSHLFPVCECKGKEICVIVTPPQLKVVNILDF